MSTLFLTNPTSKSHYHQGHVYKVENINIVQNYIPHPDTLIEKQLEVLSSKMEAKLERLHDIDRPPYISQVYGEIRRECYKELQSTIKNFPTVKKNEYNRGFFNKIDQKFQETFQSIFPLRRKYLEVIIQQEYGFTDTQKEEITTPSENGDTLIELFKSNIMELGLDWFTLVDQIVDQIARCQLYTLGGDNIFEEINKMVRKKWSKNQPHSWGERLQYRLKLPVEYIKNFFEKSTCIEYTSYTPTLASSDIFVLVSFIAHGSLVSNCLREAASSQSQEFLIALKGFLLVLIQNLEHIAQQLTDQIDKCLGSSSKKELQKTEKELFDIFVQLIELQESLFYFNEDFVRETPKGI